MIRDYCTNPLDFLDFQGHPLDGLFLGVELEVSVRRGHDLDEKALDWHHAIEKWAILKYDSSVSHGFEIVTAPASLPIHRREWARLLTNGDLLHGLARESSSCGLHVHVSRAPISPLTLGKILVFVNTSKHAARIEAIAGRNSDHFARKYDKPLLAGFEQGPSRYEAVNVCRRDTIEFRLFKSSLDLDRVLMSIEFCNAVVRWAMQASIRDALRWSTFTSYVQRNANRYRHLLEFMTTNELL